MIFTYLVKLFQNFNLFVWNKFDEVVDKAPQVHTVELYM